jgi:hypothetical protein
MPIRWTVDQSRQMLLATAEGEITLKEIVEYLNAVVAAGTMPYRKLFDGSEARLAMTDEEMMVLGVRLRTFHGQGKIGALAIVAAADKTHGLARLFGALAAADRRTKIFETLKAARDWIDAQPQ